MERKFWLRCVLLGVLAIAVLVSGGVGYLYNMRHSLWEQSVSNTLEVTVQGGKVFETYIDHGITMLEGRANNFAQYTSTNTKSIGAKLDLYEDGNPDFAAIDLQRGIIYYNSKESAAISEQELKKYLTLPQFGMLEPFISEYTGRRVIAYYERFNFADGVPGLVRKSVLFDEMSKRFALSFYDGAGFSYIVNSNGDIVLRFGTENGNRTFLNVFDVVELDDDNTREDANAFHNAMLEKNRGVMQLNFGGKECIFAFVPLKGTESWYLISTIPNDVIMEHANKMMKSTQLLVVIVLIALLVFTFFVMVDIRHRQQIHANELVLTEALRIAKIANESKSTFLANMSHDIRTPMNAIVGLTTLLERDADNPEKVREHTEKIASSSQHLLGLINDVLDMSKIETGKVSLNATEFRLSKLAEELSHIILPQAKAKKQKFEIVMQDIQNENLIGDKQRISQVLVNILSNAVKYTPSEGNVTLTIKQLELANQNIVRTRFSVKDNGIGMSEEYQKEIFQPFTREVRTTVNQVQGSGLGMAITKNLVELMGGVISVESKMGEGSTFIIDLDLKTAAPQKHTQSASSQPSEKSIAGRHFLCAEDNAINAEILIELLDMRGATAEVAENGKLALEKFSAAAPGTYDAVLMDVQMPEMNGYEATRAIRASEHPQAKDIPIVAMTANAFVDDVRDAMDSGMNAHIAKPLDMELLVEALNQLWESKGKVGGGVSILGEDECKRFINF